MPDDFRNQGPIVPPYNPGGPVDWGQQPLTPLSQTVQALVTTLAGIRQILAAQAGTLPYVKIIGDTMTGPLIINTNTANAPPVAPTPSLYLNGADATPTLEVISAYGAAPELQYRAAAGTGAAPTAVLNGTVLGTNSWRGYDSSVWGLGVTLTGTAVENFTPTAHGARLNIGTAAAGTTTVTNRVSVGQGLIIGPATGGTAGDMGPGTVNISGSYYANGASLGTGPFLPLTGGDLTGPLGIIKPHYSPNIPLTVFSVAGRTEGPQFLTNDYAVGTTGTGLIFDWGASTGNTFGRLSLVTGGGTAWGNLILQFGGGRVGIGTNSPGFTLDVNGTLNASSAITTASTITAAGALLTGAVSITNPTFSSAIPLFVASQAGQTANAWYVTNDYANGTAGSSLALDFGAATGNTYSRLSARITGNTAWGNLILQSGGGVVLIGQTVGPVATIFLVVNAGFQIKINGSNGGFMQLAVTAGSDFYTYTGAPGAEVYTNRGTLGSLLTWHNAIISDGASSAFSAADRTGGANTSAFYRGSATLTHLFDSVFGDVINYDTSGRVGINVTPTVRFHVLGPASSINAIFSGTGGCAVRLGSQTTFATIEGADNTGLSSFQPLVVGGSTLAFQVSGSTKLTITAGLFFAGATGGDKGADTINAVTYYANGAKALYNNANYVTLVDGAGNDAIYLGPVSDHQNYYRNTTHAFQSIGGGATYLGISSSNLNLTVHITPTADNTYLCGANGARWSAVWAANGTIQTSDGRGKTDVDDCDLGLDFICSLHPVSWRNVVGGNRVVRQDPIVNEAGHIVGHVPVLEAIPGKRRHYGLIAQDVKEVLGNRDFGGWVLTDVDDPRSDQALRYDQFLAPLITAVQELAADNRALHAELAELRARQLLN